MGTVHAIRPGDDATLREASGAFLATLDHPETAGTRKAYTSTLRALRAEFGDQARTTDLDPAAVAEWFAGRWGGLKPATWNRNLDALASAQKYWRGLGWLDGVGDITAAIARRRRGEDRSRALSREEIEQLLADETIPLRERLLWRMLYETAARSAELLRLDVPDLDTANRRSRVTRKGSAVDVVVWQTGTARLLPRYLKGRKTGPLFLTERRARVQLPPADIDPASGKARLSYRQAEDLFKAHSGGATLHQIRHSALTHDAEAGTSTPMLMARSGHTSVSSLARYARVSSEALQRHQERTDPARRR